MAILSFPLVNLEFAFSDAGRFFQTGEKIYLEQYFFYQANTLAIPFLSALFGNMLPFIDVIYFPRIFSAFSFILLGLAIIRFNKLMGQKIPTYLLLLIIFFNPLIWIFGGRGFADLFPAAVGLLALSLLWSEEKENSWKIWGIILLSISITLKYHAILILIPIAVEIFLRAGLSLRSRLILITKYSTGSLVIPLLYVVLVKMEFGFLFIPSKMQEGHQFNLLFILNNFVLYLGYLFLLILPFPALFLIRKIVINTRKNLLAYIFSIVFSILFVFVLGYLFVTPQGEMSFGPLDPYVDSSVVMGCFLVFAGALLSVFYYNFRSAIANYQVNRYKLALLLFLILFLFVLSATRPAQRYLIFILPLVYFMMSPLDLKPGKVWIATILIYICANIFLLINQYNVGFASRLVVNELTRRKIIEKTAPGAIEMHGGNYFFKDRISKKEYTVIDGKNDNAVFFIEFGILGQAKKSFSVIPVK